MSNLPLTEINADKMRFEEWLASQPTMDANQLAYGAWLEGQRPHLETGTLSKVGTPEQMRVALQDAIGQCRPMGALRVNPQSEKTPNLVFGTTAALADVVALSVAFEKLKRLHTNTRHELDPVKVKESLDKKKSDYEGTRIRLKKQNAETQESYKAAVADGTAHRWAKKPSGDSYVDPMVDKWLKLEAEHYALVRVIELPATKSGNRFILVYGDTDDQKVKEGTGPFATFEKAADWFYKGGR